MIRQVGRITVTCLLVVVSAAVRVLAQDATATAQDLYASAEYERALELLEQLPVADRSREEQQTIDLYRALCLLAIGRRDDAVRTVEVMITRDPLYQPGEDIPPRMQAAFSEVKKRVLPGIVQEKYRESKEKFDRKEFAAAALGFKSVLDTLDDPDIAEMVTRPPLADFRTLAGGFEELSVKAIPPPPPAEPVTLPPPPPPPPPPAPSNKIYTADDRGVVPPSIISQELPQFPLTIRPGGISGVVEIVINEAGSVESAKTVVPIGGPYDRIVLRATSNWSYQPAKMNGTPVKFLKQVQITVRDKP